MSNLSPQSSRSLPEHHHCSSYLPNLYRRLRCDFCHLCSDDTSSTNIAAAVPQEPIIPLSSQMSDAQVPLTTPIDGHQPCSVSPPLAPTVSWPLPAIQNANFVWGSKNGATFNHDICSAYERVIHWKPNPFLPRFGAASKNFVQELARLLPVYADGSSLEYIAMKGTVILQHLLQKPSSKSNAKECAKHLQRRLDLWLSGEVDVLLNEGECIQKRLSPSRPSSKKPTLAQSFAKKMKQGNVQSVLNSLSRSSAEGVLNLDDEISTGASNEKRSVRDILTNKHPASAVPSPETLLPEDQQSVAPNPIIFDSLDADLILKAALKTKGAAGLSGLDAFAWRRLCSSFKSASRDLCCSLAAVGRRLCISLVNPTGLSAFVACRLIPLDKSPEVRPIDIGEVPRRIISKAILWILSSDIQDAAGPLQVCAGQVGGCEAAIHSMRIIFNEQDVEAAFLRKTRSARANYLACQQPLYGQKKRRGLWWGCGELKTYRVSWMG